VDDDNVTEDQCPGAGPWPSALRPTMRFAILDLPLDEPVCLRLLRRAGREPQVGFSSRRADEA